MKKVTRHSGIAKEVYNCRHQVTNEEPDHSLLNKNESYATDARFQLDLAYLLLF